MTGLSFALNGTKGKYAANKLGVPPNPPQDVARVEHFMASSNTRTRDEMGGV